MIRQIQGTKRAFRPRVTSHMGWGALVTTALSGALAGASPMQEAGRNPIAEALAAVDDEVVTYNDHLTILASPWMEGRLPGTRGMELAKEYMEYYFREYGLVAPYALESAGADGQMEMQEAASYRQPFELGSSVTVLAGACSFEQRGVTLEFNHMQSRGESTTEVSGLGTMVNRGTGHFSVTGMGYGGEVKAPLVFVGYGIESEDENFSSFHDGQDLSGKIAVVLRFEPMDENGRSLWKTQNRRWSPHAQFNGKIKSVAERNPAAIIMMNSPRVTDGAYKRISRPGSLSIPSPASVPVIQMTAEAGATLMDKATNGAYSLDELVSKANEGPVDVSLDGTMHLNAEVDRKVTVAENLIGMLPGRGALAKERIVVGAHLDHLGMGEFGSRDDRKNRGRALHPGADDNASGAAGILLIAQKMAKDYAAAPEGANLRSIVFIGFSAEESGLDGSRYYVENPIGELEDHVLMMNFDMIGRMKDSRLALSGTMTGNGLQEFLDPILERSPLVIVPSPTANGGSDHQMFYRAGVPVLFSIIADFHPDYHTSRDVSKLINRVEAVHAANLFYDIAWSYAGHEDVFEYIGTKEMRALLREAKEDEAKDVAPAERPQGARSVQFGIRPDYENSKDSVIVDSVTEGSPAEAAGIQGGDVLKEWNGKSLGGARGLSEVLKSAKPGDKVTVKLDRDGKAMELVVTLRSRGGDGR